MASSSSDTPVEAEEVPFPVEEGVTPRSTKAYTKAEYWEWRFGREKEYDWLAGYDKCKEYLHKHIKATDRVLLVGCGNSTLTADMYDAGFKNLVSTDISETVIAAMAAQHAEVRPEIEWCVADMLDLTAVLEPASFDVVLDKAALDALLAAGGDVWQAPADLLEAAFAVGKGVQAVLKPGGVFLSLSFSQPHFRTQYLGATTQDEAPEGAPLWKTLEHESLEVGFGYFWYTMST